MPKLKIKLKTADAQGIIGILHKKTVTGLLPDNLHVLLALTLSAKIRAAFETAKGNLRKEFSINMPMEYCYVFFGVFQFETGYAHYVEEIPSKITSFLQTHKALP